MVDGLLDLARCTTLINKDIFYRYCILVEGGVGEWVLPGTTSRDILPPAALTFLQNATESSRRGSNSAAWRGVRFTLRKLLATKFRFLFKVNVSPDLRSPLTTTCIGGSRRRVSASAR